MCEYIHLPLNSLQSYQLLPIIVGCFFTGLDAYGCRPQIMLLMCSFLCSVFIMSQASTTMAMTATPPVNVVCSSVSSLLSAVTMAPSLMVLPATSAQHDVLPPPLTLRNSGSVVGPATVPQQQPASEMLLQAYANYATGPPQVGISFRVELSTILFFICLVYVLVYAFSFQVPC